MADNNPKTVYHVLDELFTALSKLPSEQHCKAAFTLIQGVMLSIVNNSPDGRNNDAARAKIAEKSLLSEMRGIAASHPDIFLKDAFIIHDAIMDYIPEIIRIIDEDVHNVYTRNR